MASGASSHIMPAQGKRTSFGGIAGTNASHLLERSKVGLRGSTPDSEALASSDDEPDQLHRLQKVTSNPVAKPVRRASWLTEGQQATARNASIGGNVSFSPISPSTAAPSEHTTWGANTQTSNTTAGRGHSTTTSFPWSNTIWNSDAPKGPPQRLTEVMPSPTTVVPPGSAGLYGDDGLVSPREVSADQAIPFAIPLQPTPKTYRSQSYSVGQLDPDTMKPPPSNYGGGNAYSRPRMGTYAGLQHRPSRPSMLGETSHDSQILGQLQEVDDDEDSLDLSDPGFQQSQEAALTIEQLTRENAMLRQQAAETRDRAAANNIQANLAQQLALRNRRSSRDAPSEGSDPAIYDVDTETQQSFKKDAVNGRRYSEFGANTGTHYGMSTSEHRNMESVRKGQWQSSLGFGGIPEPPQSRRHSFAEVPTRQNSTGVGMETQKVQEALDQSLHIDGKPISPEAFQRNTALTSQNEHVNYFSPRMEPTFRPGAEPRPPSSTAMQHAYAQTHYGRSQQLGMSHPRPKQLLFIVTFKCQRADVFYVQENTGLHINKGDLVIVEADRGTDLGTVASDSVPWAEAKELKDKFIEEHHRWLMMFSQHAQNGTVAGQNPNGTPQNAILGSSTGQAGLHDVPSGDLKPKMIKRVAQQHEIQNLREKEGAEAKAKRACQQKVVEHRLRMEILDAEFQMDWKKLTFFYFADSYINFNPLVTDLFKIYKTRIWMSAINTAAIASPVVNHHHLWANPSHRNYSPEIDDYSARHQQQRRAQGSPAVGSPVIGFPGNDQLWAQNQEYGAIGPQSMAHLYAQPVPAPGFDMRHMAQMPLGHYGQPGSNVPSFFNTGEYGNAQAAKGTTSNPQPDSRAPAAREPQDSGVEWNQAFQKLSLER